MTKLDILDYRACFSFAFYPEEKKKQTYNKDCLKEILYQQTQSQNWSYTQ